MTNTLQSEARTLIREAEFVRAWPAEVKDVLVRALRTDGDLPAFAEKEVKWAMKEAARIERKCAKDLEVGERNLSPADKRRLVAVR